MAQYHLKLLADEWDHFAKKALPKNAPAVQLSEMQMAFFAGAWVIVTQLKRMGGADVPEDDGVRQLQSLENECIAFQKRLLQRHVEKN